MCITAGYEIIRLKNEEEKIAWLSNRVLNNTRRYIIYCFSGLECEELHAFFDVIGIKSSMLKIGRLERTSSSQ